MQHQRESAEDDDHAQADPLHDFDMLAAQLQPANLHDGRGDRHRRRRVDVGELECDEEQDDREQVEQEFLHEEQLTSMAFAQSGGSAA